MQKITKPALNQAGINNFNNCVVLAIQLIVLVCFYYRTTTVLGCVVYNRAMFSYGTLYCVMYLISAHLSFAKLCINCFVVFNLYVYVFFLGFCSCVFSVFAPFLVLYLLGKHPCTGSAFWCHPVVFDKSDK